MTPILFYNRTNGAGALGELSRANFTTTQSFNPGAFATGWSHVERTHRGLLFYNQATGAAALGSFRDGSFSTQDTFPAGFFNPGWTHLCSAGEAVLFYRASTGEGALVTGFDQGVAEIRTARSYPAGAFACGWTEIVYSAMHAVLLFYNATTGEAAIAELFDRLAPNALDLVGRPLNDIRTLHVFPAGAFSRRWSHITAISVGSLLFYNQVTGTAAVGTLARTEFTTSHTYDVDAFHTGWTHIVMRGEVSLFYNSDNGAGAIGFDPTVKEFPAGSFAAGWTHVV